MAATYWQGGNENGNDAANWKGGIPSDLNTPAIFDGRSQESCRVNMNFGTSVSWQVKTTRDYHGHIGSPGNPLTWEGLAGSAGQNVIRGTGDCYFNNESGGNFSDYVIDPPSSKSPRIFISGQCNDIYGKGGANIIVAPDCEFAGSAVSVGTTSLITIEKKAAAQLSPNQLICRAGRIICKRIMNIASCNVVVSGGELLLTSTLVSTAWAHISGGVFKYWPDTSTSGLEPNIAVMAGVFDVSGSSEEIAFTKIVIGPDGRVKGSPLENAGFFTSDVDLREVWPS